MLKISNAFGKRNSTSLSSYNVSYTQLYIAIRSNQQVPRIGGKIVSQCAKLCQACMKHIMPKPLNAGISQKIAQPGCVLVQQHFQESSKYPVCTVPQRQILAMQRHSFPTSNSACNHKPNSLYMWWVYPVNKPSTMFQPALPGIVSLHIQVSHGRNQSGWEIDALRG